jgi:hypothetical protein
LPRLLPLTCSQDADEIIEQQRRTGTNTVQLCDSLERGGYRELRQAMPGASLVQVVHVRAEESIEEAVAVAAEVDAILLDSGNPTLAVKELGGTGLDARLERERSYPGGGEGADLPGGWPADGQRSGSHTVGSAVWAGPLQWRADRRLPGFTEAGAVLLVSSWERSGSCPNTINQEVVKGTSAPAEPLPFARQRARSAATAAMLLSFVRAAVPVQYRRRNRPPRGVHTPLRARSSALSAEDSSG